MENPLTVALRETWPKLQELAFDGANAIPSAVVALVLLTVVAIEIVLWPYGWIPVIAHFLWQFVLLSRDQIQTTDSLTQRMPFTVALGIYFVLWTPFAVLCLPFVIVGLIGSIIAHEKGS